MTGGKGHVLCPVSQNMKVLDLFSGIGGFTLGLERAGMETIAFCEIDPFCQKVLKKHWPATPVFHDIRQLTANDLPEQPDVICGGYPCQPFSVAGKQRGEEDDRYLWPEMFRLVKECKPHWVIGENVSGHIGMGLDKVLSNLEGEGYTTQALIIPACAVNAPHRRDRVWVIAHANRKSEPVVTLNAGDPILSLMGNTKHHGLSATTVNRSSVKAGHNNTQRPQPAIESARTGLPKGSKALVNAYGARIQAGIPEERQWKKRHSGESDNRSHQLNGWKGNSFWSTEPNVGRVADGVPDRVDRIKALGNAVVPQIPEIIGKAILQVSA